MINTSLNSSGNARFTASSAAIVIIGASGFIGRNLVDYLKGKVGRLLPVSESGEAVSGIPGLRLGELADADIGPGTVAVNLAAYRYDASNFADTQAEILLRNVEMLGRVYEICARKGVEEIRLASSIGVYPADEKNFDDSRPLDFNRDPHAGELMYAWSKRIGEIYGRLFEGKYGINTLIFRLTNPYGPHDSLDADKAHVVPAFIIRALTTSGPFAVRGNPEASRDFVFVGDVCEVIRQSLAWRGLSGVYNLGSSENVTIGQLARTVVELVGPPREIVVSGSPINAVPVRRCPNGRLRAAFGIDRFTTLRDGLVSTIEWYRDAIASRS